jgi:osmotically inducible lipoprotein OsmB
LCTGAGSLALLSDGKAPRAAPFGFLKPYPRIESIMNVQTLLLVTILALGLSGCLANNTERGLAGAAGGAAIAGATGGSAVTGAVVGGAAGYFCNDLKVPGCRNR